MPMFHRRSSKNIKQRLGLSLMLSLAWGCRPQGRLERTIHPPHQIFNSTPTEANVGTGASTAERTHLTQAGLPSNCKQDSDSQNRFCIYCEETNFTIRRCFKFKSSFDINRNCVNTFDSIKCLIRNPDVGLHMALKGSLEKRLLEHTRMWREGLLAIAMPNLRPDEQQELHRALAWHEQLITKLVKTGHDIAWTDDELQSLIPSESVPESFRDQLRALLTGLQALREADHLQLGQVLKGTRSLLQSAGYSEPVLAYWEALIIDGLEDEDERLAH